MAKVTLSTPLPVSVEKVWELIGGFNALGDWHPGVEKSELEDGGRLRRLSLVGGGTILERLEKFDNDEHRYRYSIVDGPLPVKNYVAEIRVRRDGNGCVVEWDSEFMPSGMSLEDAQKTIQGIYQAGFENLRRLFRV